MLVLAACAGDATTVSSTAAPATSSTTGRTTSTVVRPTTTTTTTTLSLAGVSAEFGRAVIEVGGLPYTVAVADTNDLRRRGLMGVEELSPLDGMLFVFDDEVVRSFWMKDTLIPLDIAFFDTAGGLVSRTTMATCPDGDCPSYSSERPARYALEAPAGSLDRLTAEARLVIIEALSGSGKEI